MDELGGVHCTGCGVWREERYMVQWGTRYLCTGCASYHLEALTKAGDAMEGWIHEALAEPHWIPLEAEDEPIEATFQWQMAKEGGDHGAGGESQAACSRKAAG